MNRGIRELQQGTVAEPLRVEKQVVKSGVGGRRELVQGKGQGNGKEQRARLIYAGDAFDDVDSELEMLRMICWFVFHWNGVYGGLSRRTLVRCGSRSRQQFGTFVVAV